MRRCKSCPCLGVSQSPACRRDARHYFSVEGYQEEGLFADLGLKFLKVGFSLNKQPADPVVGLVLNGPFKIVAPTIRTNFFNLRSSAFSSLTCLITIHLRNCSCGWSVTASMTNTVKARRILQAAARAVLEHVILRLPPLWCRRVLFHHPST